MPLVRFRTNDSWTELYSSLVRDQSLETILLTLSGILTQQTYLEGEKPKEKEEDGDQGRTKDIFQEVLKIFQLRSLEAHIMSLSHTDINREGYFTKIT